MSTIKRTAALATATALFAGTASATLILEDTFDSNNGGTGWAPGSSWDGSTAGGELHYTGASESRALLSPIALTDYWMSITWEQTGSESGFMTTGAWNGPTGQPFFLGFHNDFQPGDTGHARFPVETLGNAAPVGGYNTVLFHISNVVTGVSFDYETWAFAGDGSGVDPNALGAPNWVSGTRTTSNTTVDRWNIQGSVSVDFDRIAIATTAGESLVPEPGSLALLSLGGLMIARRRRG